MREIRFRAWFTKRQEMVNVETVNLFSTYVEVGAKVDHEKGGWYTPLQESTNRKTALPGSSRQVPRVVLMQYTGLKDKNGKEIYESDVVKVGQHGNHAVVIYENACFYTPIDGNSYRLGGWTDSIEIIGNVYENPELL